MVQVKANEDDLGIPRLRAWSFFRVRVAKKYSAQFVSGKKITLTMNVGGFFGATVSKIFQGESPILSM